MYRSVAILALLAGCSPPDTTKDSGTTTPPTGTTDTDTQTPTTDTTPPAVDDDLDGYASDVDCDDHDSSVHPGATELCDGRDNDCDAGIDDAAAASVDGVNYATVDEALAAPALNTRVRVCPGEWPVAAVTRTAGTWAVEASLSAAETTLVSAAGVELFAADGSAVLDLRGLTLTGATDAALRVLGGATVNVEGCVIAGNGQGIDVYADTVGLVPTLTLEASELSANQNYGDGGGLHLSLGATAIIAGSTFSGNSATHGGAIYAHATFLPLSLVITDSVFSGNDAVVGGAMYLENVALDGVNVTVEGNSASESGGGLALAEAAVSGVLVTGNDALLGGGLVTLYDPAWNGNALDPDLVGVVLDGNSADAGAGAAVADQTTLTLDATSAVTRNAAATGGGGVWLGGPAATVISDGAGWGAAATKDDNAPQDVASAVGDTTTSFDGAATFECSGAGGCTL